MKPNPLPCPRCRQPAMGAWQPLDPFFSAISGNQFKSTCRSCGAVEQRQMRPQEVWIPAEPERRKRA